MESMRSPFPQRRAEARLVMAMQVAESLGQYGWVALPQRPLTVEAEDADLIRWREAQKAGQQMKRDEARQLKQLGRWHAAVTLAEANTGGRLTTLLWAAASLHAAEHEEFEPVAAFLVEEYGISVPPFPGPWERELLVARTCRDLALLPPYLRTMERPPKQREPEPAQQEAF